MSNCQPSQQTARKPLVRALNPAPRKTSSHQPVTHRSESNKPAPRGC